MAVTTPEWLARHGGELRAEKASWVVFFDGAPQYRLTAIPVAGKFGCEVMQTINGKRVESGGTYATTDDAVRGGLEDLRKALGW
jgi:hypothetical protein